MTKVRIKATYDGPPNFKIDEKIEKLMAEIGAKWYAQGFDMADSVRDITYDFEVGEIK